MNKHHSKKMYQLIMKNINYAISLGYDTEEQKLILKTILRMFLTELQHVCFTNLLKINMFILNNIDKIPLIPYCYSDRYGRECFNARSSKKVGVDFGKDSIITFPWKINSYGTGIIHVAKMGYKYENGNIQAHRYNHLNLTIITSGRHHSMAGIIAKQGIIEAEEIDTSIIYKNLVTDGARWFLLKNHLAIGTVFDYRIAVIYSIGKMLYELGDPIQYTPYDEQALVDQYLALCKNDIFKRFIELQQENRALHEEISHYKKQNFDSVDKEIE